MTVLRSGSATDVGRVRTVNQDRALETGNLFAIADGMGGHAGGEVASRVAVDALAASFSKESSVEGLNHAFTEANAAVWRQSQDQSALRGMGTTLTAVALVAGPDGRDLVALANVGDSRAYLYSGGRIAQVTADHSLAEEKVRQGEMTVAQAAVHPHRHILTRALGVASNVEVDLWELHLRSGDRLLLCSDGLTNEVGSAQIAQVLAELPDPAAAAAALVGAANEHGGNDNITVVVVDVLVGDAGSETPPGAPPASTVAVPAAAVPLVLDPAGSTQRAGAAPSAVGDPSAEPVVGPGPEAPPDTTAAGPTEAGPGGAPDAGVTGLVHTTGQRDGTQVVLAGGGVAAPAIARPGPLSDVVEQPPTVEPPERRPAEGDKESRRARRRRLGIPRRVTFRVVAFLILVVALLGAAYGVVRWYATQNWFVTVNGSQLVVMQGRPGGVLWFSPTLVDRSSVSTAHVLPVRLPALRADVNEPSLAAARRYISNLHDEYQSQQAQTSTPPAGSTPTTGIGPSGVIPTLPTTTTTTLPPKGKPVPTTTVPRGAPPPTAPPAAPGAT